MAAEIHVGPAGDDANPGSKSSPLKSLPAAIKAARLVAGRKPVTVLLHKGIYYLPETMVLKAEDSGSGNAPVVYAAAPGEEVVISGGARLDLKWEPYRDGVMRAGVPAGFTSDHLFVNGERHQMARYPNYDPKVRHFNGYAADAISPERAAKWADPKGGFIHAMHANEWGGMRYVITGKGPDNTTTYEGGWQNNRSSRMHGQYRMVENIFQELDALGEWFLDGKTGTLYLYPPSGLDMSEAVVRVVEAPADSRAARAALKADDVILSCNGTPTDTVDDLRKACRASAGKRVSLGIWRSQRMRTVEASKAESKETHD